MSAATLPLLPSPFQGLSLPRLTSVATLAALLLAGCGGGDSGGSAALTVDGAVDRPASYSLGDLALVPPVNQAVSFLSGTTPQSHAYTGPSLWTVLNNSGVQVDASKKNDILNRYVLATGADGYKVVFALGELSPDFGNKPDLIAEAETLNNMSGPLPASDGPLRITAPGDVKGGRYVSLLNHLTVRNSASTVAGSPAGGVSASFAVSGAVLRPQRFDLGALQALPATTQTTAGTSYTGVSLFTLLNSVVGLGTDTSKNPTLAMYAVATGSDGYKAMVSLGEIDPGFGNRGALIAYQSAGAGLGANGVARLVVDGDVKQGRSVSNLIALEVFTAPVAPAP